MKQENDLKLLTYEESFCENAAKIWNEVVEEQNSFPQNKAFSLQEANEFFKSQTKTGCLFDGGEMI